MRWFLLILTMVSLWPTSATAKPDPLEQLQVQIQNTQKLDAAIRKKREFHFLKDHNNQKHLLEEIKGRLDTEKKRSDTMRKAFATNETLLASLEKTLHQNMGDLGEVFGAARQTIKDITGPISESLVSGQFPQRAAWLNALGERKKLPDMKELERLWHIMQQEIIESGQVVRFQAKVVGMDGTTQEKKVTRAGLFTAVSQGHYVRYIPENHHFEVLPRQPSTSDQTLARQLEETKDGFAELALDPTRGVLLSMLVTIPNHWERLHQGGEVGYAILILGVFGLLLGVGRLIYLVIVGRRILKQREEPSHSSLNNPLGRIIAVAKDRSQNNLKNVELLIDEAILREIPRLTRGVKLLKLLAAVAPLLGLLGTVIGMIATFQSISLFGTGDPRLMAGGISQALVTTTLGLMVAVPLLFLHALVASRSRALVSILEQQSAGLIAMVWEKS